MDGFSPLESNLVASQIQHSQSVVLQSQLLDGVDGITVELVLSDAELLKASVDLQHLSVVDGTLLPDAPVVGAVEAEGSQRAIVPVEDTGDADNSVNVELVVA